MCELEAMMISSKPRPFLTSRRPFTQYASLGAGPGHHVHGAPTGGDWNGRTALVIGEAYANAEVVALLRKPESASMRQAREAHREARQRQEQERAEEEARRKAEECCCVIA